MGCGKPCGCPTYRDHLLSVGFAASAMPSRKGDVVRIDAKERQWTDDMGAYKRLRNDGLQPRQIDGSHRLEARADRAVEIEAGALVSDFATGG